MKNSRLLALLGLTLLVSIALLGCIPNVEEETKEDEPVVIKGKEQPESTENKEAELAAQETVPTTYNKDIGKYFPSELNSELLFFGTAEYSQALKVTEINEADATLTVVIKGNVDDMAGEGVNKDKTLNYSYTIDSEKAVENIEFSSNVATQTAFKDLIILKGDIAKGNSWTQKVTLDGQEYEAKTTITDLGVDDEGLAMVHIETTVNDIEGYPDKTLKEFRVYKEGKGLYRFDKSLKLSDGGFMDFGFTLYQGR